jgi:hypothetical protein
MATWTRVTDPEAATALLPAWFATRMMATRGAYGFLLATGDVVRVSRVTAVHVAPGGGGPVLLDVLLDHAGVPDGVDLAWRPKHFLGAPVPGATLATLNLAQVVMAVEFTAAEIAETAGDEAVPVADAVSPDLSVVTDVEVANDEAERVA